MIRKVFIAVSGVTFIAAWAVGAYLLLSEVHTETRIQALEQASPCVRVHNLTKEGVYSKKLDERCLDQLRALFQAFARLPAKDQAHFRHLLIHSRHVEQRAAKRVQRRAERIRNAGSNSSGAVSGGALGDGIGSGDTNGGSGRGNTGGGSKPKPTPKPGSGGGTGGGGGNGGGGSTPAPVPGPLLNLPDLVPDVQQPSLPNISLSLGNK